MSRIPQKRLRAVLYSAESDRRLTIPDDLDTSTDFAQLEMEFRCQLTTNPKLNRGGLVIKNLSEASRLALAGVVSQRIDFPPELSIGSGADAKLVSTTELFPQGFTREETIRRGHAFVEIDSGEDRRIGRVFEGTGMPIEHRWDPSGTWHTMVTLTDGLATEISGMAQAEFPPNARLFDVVTYITRTMALESGNLTPANFAEAIRRDPSSDVAFADFPLGFVVSGDAVPLLTDLLATLGAEWFVDRGKIYIVRKGQPVQGPAAVLTPEDGLRMPPRPLPNGGVSVWVDHRRDFKLGHRLDLRTKRLAGIYRIDQLVHNLHNGLGDWSSAMILRNIETIPGVL